MATRRSLFGDERVTPVRAWSRIRGRYAPALQGAHKLPVSACGLFAARHGGSRAEEPGIPFLEQKVRLCNFRTLFALLSLLTSQVYEISLLVDTQALQLRIIHHCMIARSIYIQLDVIVGCQLLQRLCCLYATNLSGLKRKYSSLEH